MRLFHSMLLMSVTIVWSQACAVSGPRVSPSTVKLDQLISARSVEPPALKAAVGGGLVGNNGVGLVANRGGLSGTLLGPAGALIANNGGGLIANNGGGVVANNGASFRVLAEEVRLQPIAGAEVVVVDAQGAVVSLEPARTDAAGRFQLSRLKPSSSLLFLRATYQSEGQPITLMNATAAPREQEQSDIRVTPATTLVAKKLNQMIRLNVVATETVSAATLGQMAERTSASLADAELVAAVTLPDDRAALMFDRVLAKHPDLPSGLKGLEGFLGKTPDKPLPTPAPSALPVATATETPAPLATASSAAAPTPTPGATPSPTMIATPTPQPAAAGLRALDPALKARMRDGRECRDCALDHVDLTGQNLQYLDLRGADLRGAKLDNARLDGSDLTGARLDGASLKAASLGSAILKDASLLEADLTGVKGAYLDGSRAKLTGARLDGANLTGANLTAADLTGAQLGDVQLGSATLRDALLGRAQLKGVTLTFADLSRANLQDASLPSARANGADFNGAILRGADVSGATLTSANLKAADLTGAILTNANLTYATWSDGRLCMPGSTGACK